MKKSSFLWNSIVIEIKLQSDVNELTDAVHQTNITFEDTKTALNTLSRDMKERGMIDETKRTLDETVAAANEAAESFRQTVEDMKEAAPQTAEVTKKARERVRTGGKKKQT